MAGTSIINDPCDILLTGQVSVTSAATQITSTTYGGTTASNGVSSWNSNRRSLVITNTSATLAVYIGKDNTVTSSTGQALLASQSISFENYIGPVWGIAASTSVTVSFGEETVSF